MAVREAFLLALVIATISADSILSDIEYINSIQDSWTAGINDLTYKSWEEKKRLCGVLSSKSGNGLPVKELDIANNIPATFDARKHWSHCPSINSIKDQGLCSSCWAIGAASTVSDRLCIATNNRVKVNISVENLLSCCTECVDIGGCDGGYPDKAWKYLQNTGVVTGGDYGSNEGCQPYQFVPHRDNHYSPPCYKRCINRKYNILYKKDLHSNSNAYILKPKDVKAIQSEILKHGPVAATFDVYGDFFNYKSGVYKHNITLYAGRHSVRVIGWGTEKGTDYWLAANSWGRSFGLNGFFKILRGTNECNFEQELYAGLPKH